MTAKKYDTILNRVGEKTRLLPQLLPLFPASGSTFIDLFMGSAAVVCAMVPRFKFVIANDVDAEVFNLFMVLKTREEELKDSLTQMPVHETLFKHWKDSWEDDPIWRAVRFLLRSNFSFMGAGDTMKCSPENTKRLLLQRIDSMPPLLENVIFLQCDFRAVLKKVGRLDEKKRVFLYADPPYLGTGNNYSHPFTDDDARDLFTLLVESGYKFAISEFDHPFILGLAQAHGLQVFDLGERRTLSSRNREILVTNYQQQKTTPVHDLYSPCTES